MRLGAIGTTILAVNLCLFSLIVVVHSAPADEILYFNTDANAFLDFWGMDTTLHNPTQQATCGPANIGFASPQLTSEFMFQTVNVTVYHESVPSGFGTFKMWATIYAYNATGQPYYWSNILTSETLLEPGSTVHSISIYVGLRMLPGDRICVYVGPMSDGVDRALNMYWGNSTYPSMISYSGAANYVPEFQPELFIAMLIAETLMVTIVYRRKHGKHGFQE